ncbi:hypothetical protein I5U77_02840 [Stenotrophomonas maltophilia]|uniref:hypothetical protein n=1 Tax=Stenotrophomonas maltophilia TaxID=40324 RepID=UPI0013DB5BAE|nr:hypothetical protein [Stenotrophomonas maltophilia]MBH1591387.1 hypothetical protein [Stenotrophomonas maltophilia]
MAEFNWPSSLPCPLLEGYEEPEGDDGIISTTMQAGPAKRRPRVSLVPDEVSMVLLLSQAQVQTLNGFYLTTLRKTRAFNWRDFRFPTASDNVAVYRFMAKPSYRPVTPRLWKATLSLQRLSGANGHFPLDFYDNSNWPTT